MGPIIKSDMFMISLSVQCDMWRSGIILGRLVMGISSGVVVDFDFCVSSKIFHTCSDAFIGGPKVLVLCGLKVLAIKKS